ncbi:MAG: tetratricopeptide repeat protein [Pirellulales bacterium]
MWLRRCLSGISALSMFIAVANAREWTDSTGKYKTEAEFIELQDGKVKLRRQNGTIKAVPLEKLSQADQEFARQSAAAQKKKTAHPSAETKVDATSEPTNAQSTQDVIAKDIEKSVVALEYPKGTADDLARLARDWKCELWKQKLSRARAASPTGQTAEVARVEEEAAKALYETIGREIRPCDEKARFYFSLSKVVRHKKAECLGYSQLFYILGNSIGLKVRVINVLELVSGPLPLGKGHVACLVSLSDGKAMMVDLALHHVSRPFVFEQTFAEIGNYWERKQANTSYEIYRRIQILNESGVVACIYCNRGSLYSGHSSASNSTKLPVSSESIVTIHFDVDDTGSLIGQDEQLSYYTKAIELNPKLAEAYNNRGLSYGELGQDTEAISDFNKAIELNPKLAEAYNNRGLSYGELGQYTEAISDFNKAIELNPKNAPAYISRGLLNAVLGKNGVPGKTDEARSDLQKAVALNPALSEQIKSISDKFKLGL